MAIAYCIFLILLVSSAVCSVLKRPARDWCRDRSGRVRALNEEWRERSARVRCRCEYPESRLYFWDGTDPSDAAPFCQLEGCRHPVTRRVLHNGETFLNERGYFCVCRKGTDPYLMDATTLYHTECSLVLPDSSGQSTTVLNHHIPVRRPTYTPT